MAIPHLLFTTACLLFLLNIQTQTLALPRPRNYDQGPIPWNNKASLYFTVDLPKRTAALAVFINDSSIIKSGPNYVGLGISEPTSGSMLGADIISAEFAASVLNKCKFTDRYVPFFAFPLTESRPNAQGAFPFPDECQDGWTLVRCERDTKNGHMILEVTRSLDAEDTQDREIVEGPNAVIYAYGSQFEYHRQNRGSQRVVFYEDNAAVKNATAIVPLPDDIDGSVDIVATNYTVPSNVTTIYACTSKRFDVGKNDTRMIVATDVILDSPIDMVHHLTLYLCSEKGYADLTRMTVPCTGVDNGIAGPLGNTEAGCSTFVGGYAKGSTRLVIPKEAGILVTNERPYLVMETHYDNAGLERNNVDVSGMRLYYTDTLRPNRAGALQLADPFVTRRGVVQSKFEYESTCPSNCTRKFSQNINIYSSLMHMHTTGQEIYTNKFSQNETFIENMHKVNFWSDRFQIYKIFGDKPFVLKPGEQLQTTCLYDTTKRPKTKWGLATTDEMCVHFISYWPVQEDPVTKRDIGVCSFFETSGANLTFCGDPGAIGNSTILPILNPDFNDTIGAPTTFGDKADTCPTPGPMDTPKPSGSPKVPPGPTKDPKVSPGVGESMPPSPEGEDDDSSPTTTPSASSSIPPVEDDNVCFPQSATVRTKGGTTKRMDQVVIGDEVQVGPDSFSTVFMFTHKTNDVQYRFVKLVTEEGSSISLTSGHYLYLNGILSMAKTAKVGDQITLSTGKASPIVHVSEVSGFGLYNPQTMHGDIVVDGVLTSTYTKTIMPSSAHGLLAPVRWIYRLVGLDASSLICEA